MTPYLFSFSTFCVVRDDVTGVLLGHQCFPVLLYDQIVIGSLESAYNYDSTELPNRLIMWFDLPSCCIDLIGFDLNLTSWVKPDFDI